MARQRAGELLYDSEATLRLVDSALDELRSLDGFVVPRIGASFELLHSESDTVDTWELLPQALRRLQAEIQHLLPDLQQSQAELRDTLGMPQLPATVLPRLQGVLGTLAEAERRLTALSMPSGPEAVEPGT